MTSLTTIVVLVTISYVLALFYASRKRMPKLSKAPENLHYVFMVPCLNEELVIGDTVRSLLQLPQSNFNILVIDDGSTDRTAQIVQSFDDERVWLLRRSLPDAQLGKGRALNAAFKHLLARIGDSRDHDEVITCIVDADGRIARNALTAVGPYFSGPRTGAVQVGVRMRNMTSLLTRIQDFEFVTFTEIFQRGRRKLGSVGLGGNGQFTRLSALESLGSDPWTDCLTEDLDLGVRLLVKGWINHFCPTTWVSQQAVDNFRRLVRQRSRWFQGHMQCWARIPLVLRSDLKTKTIADLVYHLSSPLLVLIFSLPLAVFLTLLFFATISAPLGLWNALTGNGGTLLLYWYFLSFGLAPFYGFVYWMRVPEKNLVQSIALAHVFNIYSYMWFLAGWLAVWNVLRRRQGWAKTTRTLETTETRAVRAPG
ncbi:MAG TPA: glycosyltransferase family 2 protein [Actinomycetota bacterium]|nr:glycosyltransferase family 2 protein [Actinomycetota bacterium]